jgi:hypothetical protein
MDLAAIFHAMASYNPESRMEQEVMLDDSIFFLSVAESAIRQATKASTSSRILAMPWYSGPAFIISAFSKTANTRLEKS